MTFTKTSQKFGQWSDIRANTVYGLGFSSEPELNKACPEIDGKVLLFLTNELSPFCCSLLKSSRR